jgi:hypothetical protein
MVLRVFTYQNYNLFIVSYYFLKFSDCAHVIDNKYHLDLRHIQ